MKYLKRKGLIGKGRRIVQYETLNLTKVFIIQNPFQLALNFSPNNFIACHVVFIILHVYTPSRAKIERFICSVWIVLLLTLSSKITFFFRLNQNIRSIFLHEMVYTFLAGLNF